MSLPINLMAVMLVRIIILSIFSFLLLFQWYKSAKRSFKDFKFLFGLQFIFMLISKITDLIIYEVIGSIENLKSDPSYLLLTKLRWTLMISTIAPVFSMMVFIWFNKNRRIQIIANTSFILGSLLMILLASDYTSLQVITTVMILPLMIMAIFTFLNLHVHRRLPKFNSLLMAIAYFGYLISQVLRPFITGTGDNNIWISELIETVTWLMMGLSFIIKPRFTVERKKKMLMH